MSTTAFDQTFFDLALEFGALKFGEFELKSGRLSPYFFNMGAFNTGRALAALGKLYAEAISQSGVQYDMVFGPAYKGIPLVATTSVALADQGRDVPYCFNRKEAKAHGEGGSLVGAPLQGRVLIVDDVITAGTAIRESVDIIKAAGAEPVAVCVALDRQEKANGQQSAIQSVESELGMQAISVANLTGLLEYLKGQGGAADTLASVQQYRDQYGVS